MAIIIMVINHHFLIQQVVFTIFESLGLRPQLLDFHVKKGSGPLPNQNKPKQCAALDRITEIFFVAVASRVSPVLNKFKRLKKQKKTLK